MLYFASNVVWKTTNGGKSWTQISPDLTRAPTRSCRRASGVYRARRPRRAHRGVIYTVAPSYVDVNRIWAGHRRRADSHVTTDGGAHWNDVTPPELRARRGARSRSWTPSHFDAKTAYAAVNTLRLDDLRPHIYRTHDGGKTWTHITNGIPDGAPVNVVREDPKRKGLLFAGTEREVYVSFDDGDHWQSLRLNMPATSIRDLVIKDDDIVVGTHGRSFWILDDITPLRQIDAGDCLRRRRLFKPEPAYRVRWNKNTDTPLPPEEPAGQNPPDGCRADSECPIAAIYMNTPREPRGPWVMPGTFAVKLTANGRTVTQPLVMRMDPRVKTPLAGLARQFALSTQLSAALARAAGALRNAPAAPPSMRADLTRLADELTQLYGIVEGADETPTSQIEADAAERTRALDNLLAKK